MSNRIYKNQLKRIEIKLNKKYPSKDYKLIVIDLNEDNETISNFYIGQEAEQKSQELKNNPSYISLEVE